MDCKDVNTDACDRMHCFYEFIYEYNELFEVMCQDFKFD